LDIEGNMPLRRRSRRCIATVAIATTAIVFALLAAVIVAGCTADSGQVAGRAQELLEGVRDGRISSADLAEMTLYNGDSARTYDAYLPELRHVLQTEDWEVLGEVQDAIGNHWVLIRIEPEFGSGGEHVETLQYMSNYSDGTTDLLGGTLFEYLKKPAR
jgi:hypothetical protein